MRISPILALLLVVTTAGATEQPRPSPLVVEPTLLFQWRALQAGTNHPKPAQVDGRTVLPTEVEKACKGLRARPTDRLVYRPRSGRCSLESGRSATARWARRLAVDHSRAIDETRLDPFERSEKRVDEVEWLWLAPPRTKGLCACDLSTNDAPVATLEGGGGQTRLVGTAIDPIVFSGADGTTNNISGSFEWRLDASAAQGGLPPGLSSACSPDVGTIICTVTGTAPFPGGTYLLTFKVFDGQFSDTSSTNLVSTPQLIFGSGFESN